VVKRRTLGEGLTPEEEDFLHGSIRASKAEPKDEEKKPMAQAPVQKEYQPPVETIVSPPLQTGMVGLNTRVEPKISAALYRASVDRKIQRQARAAVQDIVNEALTKWLQEQGYLAQHA